MMLREERAQATVEMAIVTPVLIVLALIVYNLMMFSSAVARFDRVAPDIVLAHGVSPDTGGDGGAVADASAAVAAQLERAMGGYGLDIEVTGEQDASDDDGDILALAGSLRMYTCTMRYTPWPQVPSIAGVRLGAPVSLVHTREVIVDPWRSGVVV